MLLHLTPSPFFDLSGTKYHSQRHHPFPDLCEPFHFLSFRMGDQERDRILDERRELRDMLLYGLNVPVRMERMVRIETDRAFPVQIHEDVVKRTEMHIAKPGRLFGEFYWTKRLSASSPNFTAVPRRFPKSFLCVLMHSP